MGLAVYVAASSTELERASLFMREVRARDFEVTLDWPKVIAEAGGVANPTDVPRRQLMIWARADLQAVQKAWALVLLAPHDGSPARGAFGEFCYAIGCRLLTIAVPSPAAPSIFVSLADHLAESDAHALELLEAAAFRISGGAL